MAFVYSANVITQSGTDANLAGLSGLTGVTVLGDTYVIDASTRLIVTGNLTLIPEDNTLVFLDPGSNPGNPRMEINGTATFNFGEKVVIGSATVYSRGTGLTFYGSGGSVFNTESNGALVTQSGAPTINFFGGTIVSGRPISLMGTHLYRGTGVCSIENTAFSMPSNKQLRIDNDETATVNLTNLKLKGETNNVVLVSEDYNFFSSTFEHFIFQSFAAQLKALRFDDFSFLNNQATSDLRYNGGGEVLAFANSDTGSDTRRSFGSAADCHFAFYGTAKVKTVDASNVNITTAKYYVEDSDDTSRFSAIGDTSNITGIIAPYGNASLNVYSGSVDGLGEASPVILLSTWQRTVAGELGSDYSNGGSYNDEFKVNVVDYSHILGNQTLQLRNIGGTDFKYFLLSDSSITETTKATVDAYTSISTAAEFYDRAKSYLYDNFGGEDNTLVSRTNNEIDAGAFNIDVDATAAQVFAFDGSKITIKSSDFIENLKTTGLIQAVNGAVISGTIIDTNGDSTANITIPTGFTTVTLHNNQSDADNGINAINSGLVQRYDSSTLGGLTLWFKVTGTSGEIVTPQLFPIEAGVYNFELVVTPTEVSLQRIENKLELIVPNTNLIPALL